MGTFDFLNDLPGLQPCQYTPNKEYLLYTLNSSLVPESSVNNMIPISTKTDTALDPIDLSPVQPILFAVKKNGLTAFVSDAKTNKIAIVDLIQKKVLSSFSYGAQSPPPVLATALSLSPDEKTLFITTKTGVIPVNVSNLQAPSVGATLPVSVSTSGSTSPVKKIAPIQTVTTYDGSKAYISYIDGIALFSGVAASPFFPLKSSYDTFAVGRNALAALDLGKKILFCFSPDLQLKAFLPMANPTCIAFSPKGDEIYVGDTTTDGSTTNSILTVLNTNLAIPSFSISLPSAAIQIVFTPDGKKAYVAIKNGVVPIKLATKEVLPTISLKQTPATIAIAALPQSN
ncbi:MAG: hypothetical protein JSR76_00325 [Verrucomicrobia bacterium]|nr:hypothetical protein [Verrucomicrobiota bacterium]